MRFATVDQINQVAAWQTAIETYQGVITGLVETLAGYVEAVSPDSGIETRFISSQDNEVESWRGALLASSPTETKVDVWYLTVKGNDGESLDEIEIGSFNQVVRIAIDYFYDFDFGTDADNSEEVFNERIDALTYVFEQIRTCLPSNAEILIYQWTRTVKQFKYASTHIARCDLFIKLSGL